MFVCVFFKLPRKKLFALLYFKNSIVNASLLRLYKIHAITDIQAYIHTAIYMYIPILYMNNCMVYVPKKALYKF